MGFFSVRRFFLTATLLAAVIACSESDAPAKPDSNPTVKSMQINHPNGLILSLPDGAFHALQSETGFLLGPLDAESLRNPFEIEVSLQPGARPEGDWPKSRYAGNVTAYYRIAVAAGGSSGDQYMLTAWIPCAAASHIIVRQTQQSEAPEKPDFSPAWTVLGAARCEEPTHRH